MSRASGDHFRPLGVPGESPDLSVQATPAIEDIRNALTIVTPLADSLVRESLTRLLTRAIAKLETRKAWDEMVLEKVAEAGSR